MKTQIINQLTMNGYKIDETENAFFATRPDNVTIMIRLMENSIRFYAHYNSNHFSRINEADLNFI